MKKYLLSCFLIASILQGYSQNLMNIPLKDIREKKPLSQLLIELEKSHPIKFFYLEEWIDGYYVDEHFNGYTLQSALEELLGESDITITSMYGYAVIFVKDPAKALDRQNILRTAAVQKKTIAKQRIGSQQNYIPGRKVILTGVVKSESHESALSGVLVWVEDLKLAATTDNNGHYQIAMPAGDHVINFRYVNFTEKVIDLSIYENGSIDVMLEETPIVLEEVVVSDQALLNRRVGQSTLKIKDIKRAPAFLGEIDIIKQIQTQAGVTSVGEVASGFNVRGGGVDQNLVLFDGMPIFNTSHALGFFTAFNSDVVNQVSFYKGGMPAEYGGRVSSVLDITSQEGNKEKWTGSGGIGIISSHLTVGGPIKKDTTSLIVSIRSSYSNWMLNSIRSKYQNLQNSTISFYDGSLKFDHKFSSKTKMILSGYTSNDHFTLSNDTLYNWKNVTGSLRIDHTLSDRLFSSVTLGMGSYAYQLSDADPKNAFNLNYSVSYPTLKFDFNRSGSHELSFGLHNTMYDFHPGELKPTNEASAIKHVKIPNEKSIETALYLSDGFYWRENLFVEAGLRYSIFNRIGAARVYKYQQGSPLETRNIIDSVNYSSGNILKTYHGAEPRISFRYTLTPLSSIKLGYNRIYQYVHLITNTAAVTPIDIWQSSNNYFRPQIADQVSLGYFRNLHDTMYETFVEGFYKHVKNTLDFKDGADLILNKNLETALLRGIGQSYGVEFSATKVKGRLVGTVNYTFSRSLRRVNGYFDVEKINKGDWFPSNFDQPHVVNLNGRYNISRRYFLSYNFTYHTGRPLTLPLSAYNVDGVTASDFSGRNKYRIPDYHRLDIALIIEGNHKRKKIWDGTWSISVYNVYSRKNAYSIFFKNDGNGALRPYKLSVIGTAIPSISYSFKF